MSHTIVLFRIAIPTSSLQTWDGYFRQGPLGAAEEAMLLDNVADGLQHLIRTGEASLYSYEDTGEIEAEDKEVT